MPSAVRQNTCLPIDQAKLPFQPEAMESIHRPRSSTTRRPVVPSLYRQTICPSSPPVNRRLLSAVEHRIAPLCTLHVSSSPLEQKTRTASSAETKITESSMHSTAAIAKFVSVLRILSISIAPPLTSIIFRVFAESSGQPRADALKVPSSCTDGLDRLRAPHQLPAIWWPTYHSSGSLAMFGAIRRAASRVSSLAAARCLTPNRLMSSLDHLVGSDKQRRGHGGPRIFLSMRKAVQLAKSPPAEKPCRRRANTIRRCCNPDGSIGRRKTDHCDG
jgi:hypothetical protein